MASHVALQPETASAISGLQVTIDGVPLASPYLSVLELTNDGEKPIPTSDYEASLEIRLQGDAKVARAQVTASNPKDLEPKLKWDSQVIRIAPLLLNPRDSLTISVLTSGKQPIFTPHARVAGVSSVSLDETISKAPTWKAKLPFLVGALLMFIASDITNEGFLSRNGLFLRRRSAILVSSLTGVSGAAMFMAFLDTTGVHEIWQIALAFIALLFVTGVVAAVWNWAPRAKPSSTDAGAP